MLSRTHVKFPGVSKTHLAICFETSIYCVWLFSMFVSDHTPLFWTCTPCQVYSSSKKKKSCPKARVWSFLHCSNRPACELALERERVLLIMEPFIPRESSHSCLTLQCTQTKHLLQPEKPVITETGYVVDGVQTFFFLWKCYNLFFSIVVIFKKMCSFFSWNHFFFSFWDMLKKVPLIFWFLSLVKTNLLKFGLDKCPANLATQILDWLQTVPL